MTDEEIKVLKCRAKEMLDNNNTRQIGAEEIYTILCECENFKKENKELKEENELGNKIIDKMSEFCTSPVHSKEWVKEYFRKEVQKDEKI